MRRRDFITVLGVAAVVWPGVALGQQSTIPTVGSQLSEMQEAAHAAGVRSQAIRASTDGEIDSGFEAIAQLRKSLRSQWPLIHSYSRVAISL